MSTYTYLGEGNCGCEIGLDCLLFDNGDCNYVESAGTLITWIYSSTVSLSFELK